MQEPFELILELHEDTEVGDLGHIADDHGTGLVAIGDLLGPRIGLELLETQRDTLALLVHLQHDSTHRVALLDDLVRVDDLACPRHVGDVQQTVDAILELDKGAVVREVAHLAFDDRTDRVLLGDEGPGIDLDLLHAERDLLLLLLDLEDDDLDFVADRDDLVRMVDALGPRHLGNVDESLDPGLELDERTVRQHVDDLAADPGADRVLRLDTRPGALFLLLETERDAFLGLVDLEDLDLDVLINLQELARVVDSPPAHVGDMKQSVETAEVDEGAELGDVLDDALADLADLDVLEELLLLLVALLLDQTTTRHDDVHARFIDLDDLALHLLADVLGDVAGPTDADLRRGQEDRDSDLHEQASLDLARDLANDVVTLLVRRDNPLPAALTICLALRQSHQAVIVLDRLQENFHGVAGLEFCGVLELIERDRSLGLVADVDDGVVADDVDHLALDDLVLLEALCGVVVPLLDAVLIDAGHRRLDLLLDLVVGKIELLDLGVGGHGKKQPTTAVQLLCASPRTPAP